ncbi:Fur family transcriptional regulator [Salidesulfovibrio brasiliensis]|uniref:Fur family transcriptional regulator n=1 Tax=Salidesulfovibrio brasiliensis TaxID=221711 RepID=UPI001FDED417|nr:Fur family transcriptional regulator [Salidesulfovibrio brasiliensis]
MDYLRERDMNLTPQRALIVEAFLAEEGHFTSEQLYIKARKADPSIGQATVYRTLKLLVDSGLAETFDIGEGVALYEHGYGHAHHDHLICTKCGRKVEIVDEVIERRQEDLAEEQGFTLTRHRMLLFGTCPQCLEGKES